jgi:hypothetical protein
VYFDCGKVERKGKGGAGGGEDGGKEARNIYITFYIDI